MGYLDIANNMVENSMDLLDNVLNSKFTTYLQGNGTPTFVTYYNIDETLSTLETGSYTVDKILGDDSPLRYNRIENFPVYGLKELLPSIEELEGNLYDLSIDTDIIILPNTIKPSAYDYFVYHYLDNKSIVFKIYEFEFTSIKNNDFYKLSISLKDINDNSTEEKLEKQVVKGYKTRLDNIGTQDKCIIEDKIFSEIGQIQNCINVLIEHYINTFYDQRYNSIILRNSPFIKYPMYDPYLTKFLVDNEILDTKDKFIVLVNTDYRYDIERLYKYSIYRAIETRNLSKLQGYYIEPTTFKTVDTNPFGYYGEENVFTLELYKIENSILEDTNIVYGDKYLLHNILSFHPDSVFYKESRPSEEVMVDTESEIICNNHNFNDIYEDYDTPDSIEDILPELDNNSEIIPEPTKPLNPSYMNFIRDYLTINSLYDLFTIDDINELLSLDINDDYTDFVHIPLLIFILKKYLKYMNNNK